MPVGSTARVDRRIRQAIETRRCESGHRRAVADLARCVKGCVNLSPLRFVHHGVLAAQATLNGTVTNALGTVRTITALITVPVSVVPPLRECVRSSPSTSGRFTSICSD